MGHVVRAHAHCKFYQKNILTPIRLDLERPNSVYGENTCGRGVFIGVSHASSQRTGPKHPILLAPRDLTCACSKQMLRDQTT